MDLNLDLAGLSREELVELVGQLLRHAAALEARIAELEGQQKPPAAAVKKPEPPSWVKANRPDRPRKERKKRTHGFARLREEPTDRVEHATASCPDCQVPLLDGRVCGSRQVITLPRVRARGDRTPGIGTGLPQVPEAVDSRTGLELPDRGPATGGHLGAERSKRIEGGVPAPLPSDSTLSEVVLWPAPQRGGTGGFGPWSGGAGAGRSTTGCAKRFEPARWCTGDETGWREDGRNGISLELQHSPGSLLSLPAQPGPDVVEEVLGDEFEGVLVSDFYGAYNVYQGPHQRCWVHLLRDIHKLNEQYPQHQNLAEWSQQVREVYGQARAWPGPDPDCRTRCNGPGG